MATKWTRKSASASPPPVVYWLGAGADPARVGRPLDGLVLQLLLLQAPGHVLGAVLSGQVETGILEDFQLGVRAGEGDALLREQRGPRLLEVELLGDERRRFNLHPDAEAVDVLLPQRP